MSRQAQTDGMGQTRTTPGKLLRRRISRAPTYNLFRRKCSPDLYCAVPETEVVPDFLSETHSQAMGRNGETGAALPGFHPMTPASGCISMVSTCSWGMA